MMLGAGESVARHAAFAVDAVVLYAGMVALTAHLSDPWTVDRHDFISKAYGTVCFSFASRRNLCGRTKGTLQPEAAQAEREAAGQSISRTRSTRASRQRTFFREEAGAGVWYERSRSSARGGATTRPRQRRPVR